MIGTNYIGAFAMTKLLLPLLESSPVASRIVNVTSFTHRSGKTIIIFIIFNSPHNIILYNLLSGDPCFETHFANSSSLSLCNLHLLENLLNLILIVT